MSRLKLPGHYASDWSPRISEKRSVSAAILCQRGGFQLTISIDTDWRGAKQETDSLVFYLKGKSTKRYWLNQHSHPLCSNKMLVFFYQTVVDNNNHVASNRHE